MHKHVLSLINSILNFIFLYILLLTILPIFPDFLQSGLDPSWRAVIDFSTEKLNFGNDIIFTYGPLGSFWFPSYYYNPNTYFIAWIMSFFLAITLYSSFLLLFKQLDTYYKIIIITSILASILIQSTFIWFFLPVLLVYVYFIDSQHNILKILTLYGLLFFLSFSILVKFSHFPTAFLSVFIIDIYNYIKYKKISYYTIILFLILILLFLISGQNLLNFVSYFLGSLSTLSGYSESMQIDGNYKMIYLFLSLSTIVFFFVIDYLIKYRRTEDIFFTIISILVIFISFKNGFIRHDFHALGAFSGLLFTSTVIFIYFSNYLKKNPIKFNLFTILIVISIVISIFIKGIYSNKSFFGTINMYKNNLSQRASILLRSLSKERINTLKKEYYHSIKKVKNEFDLSDIKGTVDIYPWDQSYILANELKYFPRPLFQSYSVYTPSLINRNKDFLYSDKSSQNILFSIKEIDNRLPSMMEGATWLDIMSLYNFIEKRKNFLLLKKTISNKSYELTKIDEKISSFNQSIYIPKGYIYSEIYIKKTLFGNIINTLFKSPILYIELTFDNGTTEKKRIIPGIASKGFILSPYLDNINKFLDFSRGKNSGKVVKSIKLINNSNCCYENNILIKFKMIKTNNF